MCNTFHGSNGVLWSIHNPRSGMCGIAFRRRGMLHRAFPAPLPSRDCSIYPPIRWSSTIYIPLYTYQVYTEGLMTRGWDCILPGYVWFHETQPMVYTVPGVGLSTPYGAVSSRGGHRFRREVPCVSFSTGQTRIVPNPYSTAKQNPVLLASNFIPETGVSAVKRGYSHRHQ